jgi:hypothetical protein
MPFQLIVGEQEEDKEEDEDDKNAPEQVNLLEEIFPERELKPQQQPVEEPAAAEPAGTKNSSSKKITLKLEDDNEKKGPKQGVQSQPQQPQASKNAPRIFLQDDDPEFEDFDEEDPDDDLEI